MKFSSAWKSTIRSLLPVIVQMPQLVDLERCPVPALGARLTISKDMRFNPLRTSTPLLGPGSGDMDGSRLRSPAETAPAAITTQQRSHEEANREGAATSSTVVCHQECNNVEEQHPGGVGNSFDSQLNSLHNEDNQEDGGSGEPQPGVEPAPYFSANPLQRLTDEQLLVFSMKVYDQTSLQQIERDFRFSSYNSRRGVHMTADLYLDTSRKIMQDHGWHQDVLCSFCGSNLQSKNAICQDPDCKLQRKRDPIDVVRLIGLANEYYKLGRRDLETLVHQQIEMAHQINVSMTLLTRSAETASSLQRQLTQEARRRVRIYADHFGSPDYKPAAGEYAIPESRFGPGCSLAEVYLGLQNSETFPKVVNEMDAHRFFRQFVKDVVTKAYDPPNRMYVTARKRPHANDFIELPYRIIVDFVIDTMKAGGAALFDEEDELERSRTEKGKLHCIQVALEIYRRQLKTGEDEDENEEQEE
ncbi:hypothetical protein Y032_0052g2186 [Ancylostoma ceylanicum]|nr:hypothetical protein Y032_0052g2186 [Ancylostoma ceylanicum]